MGLLMRDGLKRLTNVKGYSGFFSTICVNTAWTGFIAGTGVMMGPDPREMAKADCVVIWGTNAVSTQVNVMTHATRARKERGAKIVVVDIYRNDTMKQADLALCLRPGTDGALACAVMHVLFRDGFADRAYLARYTDAPEALEAHLATRDPRWASAITGLPAHEIEAFAALVGARKRTYFRLGYGFSRQRNGAANMHAAACIAAVTGAWAYEGGGAFHNNAAIYHWRKTLIEGLDAHDPDVRMLDQSRIGAVLCGETEALAGGGPVKALLVQSTNPVVVAPAQGKVKRGFARDDLFVCVHEHFMTETAGHGRYRAARDDVSGTRRSLPGRRPPISDVRPQGGRRAGECRSNHDLVCALAGASGVEHRGFADEPARNHRLDASSLGLGHAWRTRGQEVARRAADRSRRRISSKDSHIPDRRFRFRADWATRPSPTSA